MHFVNAVMCEVLGNATEMCFNFACVQIFHFCCFLV